MRPVPNGAAYPLPHKLEDRGARPPFRQPLEEQRMIDLVKKCVDVAVDDVHESQLAALPDTRNGAVHRAPRPVAETAFEKLLFEGPREMPRDGRLQDAVANGRHEQRAGGGRLRMLLDDDLEQRKGPVCGVVRPLEESRQSPVRPRCELRDGDAVGPGTPVILADTLPGFPELLDGERQGHKTS